MNRRDDRTYLGHILEAIDAIEQYLDGKSMEEFCADRQATSAAEYELIIVGEAANNLTEVFRKAHPEIPYTRMVEMRNHVVHEYFGTDKETVWKTCTSDLPPLKRQIEKMLEEMG